VVGFDVGIDLLKDLDFGGVGGIDYCRSWGWRLLGGLGFGGWGVEDFVVVEFTVGLDLRFIGLEQSVGGFSFVGVGLEIFDNVADVFGGDIYLIGFGVDVKQDDNFGVEDLIDDAIATAFAFADVAVFGADFEDGITNAGDLVAGNFALFELGDEGLDVLADLAVAFGEVADLAFEFVSDEDLGRGGFRHRFRSRGLQRG
jgi:hypothetical protein